MSDLYDPPGYDAEGEKAQEIAEKAFYEYLRLFPDCDECREKLRESGNGGLLCTKCDQEMTLDEIIETVAGYYDE